MHCVQGWRISILVTLGLACSRSVDHPGLAPTITEYRGGRWFDGTTFAPRTMWVVDRKLAAARPSRVDSVVELGGGFVVPPFAEGHNHWLEPALIDTYISVHLRQGIFYVKDMSTPPVMHDAIRAKLNMPTSVDYVAAHQGFTSPGCHPIELLDQLVQLGALPASWGPTHGEGDAVFAVVSEQDVDRVWQRLVDGRPDFVKLFLAHSDEYAAHRDDPKRSPKNCGIDPKLVPGIVQRAHAAGLRVTAHIANAYDVHVAIAAGVDDLAHMPFVEPPDLESYRIADADVRAAGARKMSIATTFDHLYGAKPDDPRLPIARDNIARLRAAGALVTIGTDLFRTTARTEADQIAALQLMTNLELLVAWTMTTPRAMFRERDIGRLGDGAEASFLVLAGDPLADFAQTHQIVRWLKQGVPLSPPAVEMPPLQ